MTAAKKTNKPLIIEASKPWYESTQVYTTNYTNSIPSEGGTLLTSGQVSLIREKAKTTLKLQGELYQNEPILPKSDLLWYEKVKSDGTQKDKLSATILLISSSPVYYIKELQSVLSSLIIDKTERKETKIEKMEAILDLFLNHLLPDFKLKLLEQRIISMNDSQGFGSFITNSSSLIYCWYVEDLFKRAYIEFLSTIKEASRDVIFYVKDKSIQFLSLALISKPEQDTLALYSLLDKFFDSNRKISSKVHYLLSSALKEHPNMAGIIVDGIWEKILSQETNASTLTAKYYALLFCSQIFFTKENSSLAEKLVSIYIKIFTGLLKLFNEIEEKLTLGKKDRNKNQRENKKNKLETKNLAGRIEKLILVCLNALHKALPFSTFTINQFEEELATLYKLVHQGTQFNMSLQSLYLLYRLLFPLRSSSSQLLLKSQEKYYKVAYNSLNDTRIFHLSLAGQHHLLLLMGKLMLKDENSNRIQAYLKRLFQVATGLGVPFITALIALTIELVKSKPMIKSLFTRTEEFTIDDQHLAPKYDTKKMDPEFANAQCATFIEMIPLLNHYHPSINKLSQILLDLLKSNKYRTNKETFNWTELKAFESLSISAFLDRFICKRPKKSTTSELKPPFIEQKSNHVAFLPKEDCFSQYLKVKEEKEKIIEKNRASKAKKRATKKKNANDVDSMNESDLDDLSIEEEIEDEHDSIESNEQYDDNAESQGDDIESNDELNSVIDMSDLDMNEENELMTDFPDEDGKKERYGQSHNKKSSKKSKLPMLAFADDYEEYLNPKEDNVRESKGSNKASSRKRKLRH